MLNTVYLQYLTLGYFYFFIFILLLNNFITFYFMERLNNVIHDNLFPTKKWWNHIICSSSKFYIIELRDVNLEHVKQDSLYKEKYSVMQYWKKKNSKIFRQTYMHYWNTRYFKFSFYIFQNDTAVIHWYGKHVWVVGWKPWGNLLYFRFNDMENRLKY